MLLFGRAGHASFFSAPSYHQDPGQVWRWVCYFFGRAGHASFLPRHCVIRMLGLPQWVPLLFGTKRPHVIFSWTCLGEYFWLIPTKRVNKLPARHGAGHTSVLFASLHHQERVVGWNTYQAISAPPPPPSPAPLTLERRVDLHSSIQIQESGPVSSLATLQVTVWQDVAKKRDSCPALPLYADKNMRGGKF